MAQPSGAAANSSNAETDIDLGAIARFVSGSRHPICLCAAVCGLVYGCWAWWTVPTLYLSKAVVVLPSRSRYSPQGFQKLLESYAVVDKTVAELRSKGICAEGEELTVGEQLKSVLLTAPVGSIVPSALEVSVSHPDRKKAPTITAAWVAVLSEKAKEAAADNPARVLDEDFLAAKNALAKSEATQSRMEAQSTKEQFELQAQYRKQLAEHYLAAAEAQRQYLRETAKLVAAKEAEDRVALAEFKRGRLSLEWLKAQVHALQELEMNLREQQSTILGNLQAKPAQIEQVAREMAQIPQLLNVRRFSSEDPTARATGRGHDADSQTAENRVMSPGGGKPPADGYVAQEINPLYASLSNYLVTLKAEAVPLTMRAKQVAEELKSVHDEAVAMDKTMQAEEAALTAILRSQAEGLTLLQGEREIGRKVLDQQQSLEEAKMQAQANIAAEDLRREHKTRLAPLTRQIAQETELHTQIAGAINQGELATKQQGLGEVQVARPPTPVPKTLSRYMPARVLAAMFVGALLGALISFVRRSAWRGGNTIG